MESCSSHLGVFAHEVAPEPAKEEIAPEVVQVVAEPITEAIGTHQEHRISLYLLLFLGQFMQDKVICNIEFIINTLIDRPLMVHGS